MNDEEETAVGDEEEATTNRRPPFPSLRIAVIIDFHCRTIDEGADADRNRRPEFRRLIRWGVDNITYRGVELSGKFVNSFAA